jgi:hypothetical protein
LNYKELYHIALLLISSPSRAWEEIRLIEDKQQVFIAFVYPMIGLCGLSVFVGSLLVKGWDGPQSFQYAMTECCAIAVSLFGGYFLAAYLINELRIRLFGQESDLPLVQQFVGYAMVVLFLLHIILGVLPGFHIIALFLQFYTVCVVWKGVYLLIPITERTQLRLTIVVSVLLILCPWAIGLLFNFLTSTL